MVELIKTSGSAVTLKIVTAKSPLVNGTDHADGKGMWLLQIRTAAVECVTSETRYRASALLSGMVWVYSKKFKVNRPKLSISVALLVNGNVDYEQSRRALSHSSIPEKKRGTVRSLLETGLSFFCSFFFIESLAIHL